MKRMVFAMVVAAVSLAMAETWTNVTGSGERTTPDGSEELTIAGAACPGGALAVKSGTVTLAAPEAGSVCGLDDGMTNGLVFWLDANTNVIVSGSDVQQWSDVREAMPSADALPTYTGWKFPRAVLYTSPTGSIFGAVAPTLLTEIAEFPGRRAVDFGEYQSGKWLEWVNAAGTLMRYEVRSFFCVVGFGGSAGFLLGDTTNLEGEGGGWTMFHRGNGDSMQTAIASMSGSSVYEEGETRLNGVRVAPMATSYKYNAYQLFSQNGPYTVYNASYIGPPFASTFFNDRNYKAATSSASTADRQGGGKICEMLIFNRVMTDTQRAAVEAYLNNKWFGKSAAGRVALDSGTALAVTGAVDTAVMEVSGLGRIKKSGNGELTVERNAGFFGGSLKLEGGAFAVGQKAGLPAIEPVAGKALSAAERRYDVADGTAADGFEIAGVGSNAVVRLASWSGLRSLSVTNAAIVLQPPATEAPALVSDFYKCGNLISNGDFETPSVFGLNASSAPGYWSYTLPTGWTRGDNTGLGLAIATNNCPWYAFPAPLGRQVMFLQAGTSALAIPFVQQAFTVPARGLYKLRFWLARRNADKSLDARALMYVDDAQVFYTGITNFVIGASNGSSEKGGALMREIEAELPPLEAGTHTLKVTLEANNLLDRAIVIDDLRLLPLEEGEFAYVPNAGFESCERFGKQGSNGFFVTAPTKAGWGFSPGYTGITQYSGWWVWLDPYSETMLADSRKAFIQRTGHITNVVTFARDGRVRFSMRYGNRANNSWSRGAKRPVGHSCEVYLGETKIGSVAPVTELMRTYQTTAEVKAGTYALKLQNALPDSQDYATIVDDVRFKYIDNEGGIVSNAAFVAELADGWTAIGSPVRVDTESGSAASLAEAAGIEQSIAIPSNGVYCAAIAASGRLLEDDSTNGVYNSAAYYAHTVEVTVDGVTAGSIRTDTPQAQQYVLRLPRLTAGSHVLRIQGVAWGTSEAASLIREVRLVPLAVGGMGAFDFGGTTMALTSDSRVRLDFEGPIALDYLRIDGRPVTGVFSAETHPGLFSGPGALVVNPKGTAIQIR